MATHEGELTVSDEAVRALVIDQFPQWSGDPIRRISSNGTVNAIFRIGAVGSSVPVGRRRCRARF